MMFILKYFLLIVTVSTVCSGLPLLLFANRYNICSVEVTTPQRTSPTLLIAGLEDAAAVDFIYQDRAIYWTDVSKQRIKRVRLNGGPLYSTDIITTGLVAPDGLACDWVTRKLYWVDSETNRVEVSSLNGRLRTVLYWQKIDQPRAIALDPLHGYIYWTDWGEEAKIERAGMDGSIDTRSVIVSKDIFWPNGLTLDYIGGRMYWTDAKLKYVHSALLDGTDRRSVVDPGSLFYPFSITIQDDTIYWTDWQKGAIFSANKAGTGNQTLVAEKLYSPMGIHVYGAGRQLAVASRCTTENGGCSHLCLLSPHSPYFKCACPTGVKLLSDNTTCADGPQDVILLVRRSDIRVISLDTPILVDVVLDIPGIKHAISSDYDPIEKKIYWTDDEVHAIRRANLNGSNVEFVISSELTHPDGIAVDWVARNLYWTDTGTNRIEVSRLDGSSRKIIIADGIDEPRAIVVDPIGGRLFWTDWGSMPKIEVASLDGSGRQTIVSTDLIWPNGLALDRQTEKIYWADAKLDKIEYANLDGSHRRTLVSEHIPHIFGLSLLGDFVYWTDWQRRCIERADKNTGKRHMVILDQLPDLMGISAFNTANIHGENACSKDNGGCSHLCLNRQPPSEMICGCPFPMELRSPENKTCVVPEALLLYVKQGEIHMMSLGGVDVSAAAASEIKVPLTGPQTVTSIDFDFIEGRIYWTDKTSKSINRAYLNGSAVHQIMRTGVDTPRGVAVDWIGRNLYWIDEVSRRIHMSLLDGSSRSVIVWNDINAQAIALDPAASYMYWINGTLPPSLERASLDGMNRQTIIANLTGRVPSLTIDHAEHRIYWVTSDIGRVESCDLDGHDRRQVVTGLTRPLGLTLYNDQVFWTDSAKSTIETSSKLNRSDHRLVKRVNEPVTVVTYHASRQLGSNSCAASNNRLACSHLCISTRRKSNAAGASFRCACPTHYKLSADNRTCEPPSWHFLLSQKNGVMQLSVGDDDDDWLDNGPDVLLSMSSYIRGVAKALEYDPGGDFIYWIDRTKTIKRAKSDGSNMTVLLDNPLTHDTLPLSPFDIKVSVSEGQLYWSDSQHNLISVMHLDGTKVGVIVNSSEQKPRNIALAPDEGFLFWTNVGRVHSIVRANVDGSAQISLYQTDLGRLGALTVDVDLRRVFWVNQGQRRIESCGFDGNEWSVMVENIPDAITLAIHADYLYWADKETRFIERVDTMTGKLRSTVRLRLSLPIGSIAVALALPVRSTSASPLLCRGRCSHFCVRDEHSAGGIHCSCPHGMVLNNDERTCALVPQCDALTQFRCAAGRKHCIPLMWRCDGTPECDDGSDERNCNFSCESGHLIKTLSSCESASQCFNGSEEARCTAASCEAGMTYCGDTLCISASQRCNGVKDCPGGADEFNCTAAYEREVKDEDIPGASSSAAIVIIGIISGLIFILVFLAVVYLCLLKRAPCGRNPCDISSMNKSLTCTSSYNDQIGTPQQCGSTCSSLEASLLPMDRPGPWQRQSCGPSSTQQLHDWTDVDPKAMHCPNEPLNPPPSPVSTVHSLQSSDGLSSLRNGGHLAHGWSVTRHPPTPCSTDVCDDSDGHLMSGTEGEGYEGGYETDALRPPPPTPYNYFSDETSSLAPSTTPSLSTSLLSPRRSGARAQCVHSRVL